MKEHRHGKRHYGPRRGHYHADMLSLAEASRHLGVRAEKVAAVDNLMR